MRYGENPHQHAFFYGDLEEVFAQLHGKELSYNNLVDVDAAIQLINEFSNPDLLKENESTFAIIKHTNVCGVASRTTVKDSWDAALAGDPESAFGGVLICNKTIDKDTASAINEIFFEVLIAPAFNEDAFQILKCKEEQNPSSNYKLQTTNYKLNLNLFLTERLFRMLIKAIMQNGKKLAEEKPTSTEKEDLKFANIVCKHLKSNAIALVKNKQLVGKGCGQTSRVDSVRQAIEKAKQFKFDLQGAVLASDAFFPFNDCVQLAHAEGVQAFIQPGGSIRDKDSIDYCVQNNLAMVMTGLRHFKH